MRHEVIRLGVYVHNIFILLELMLLVELDKRRTKELRLQAVVLSLFLDTSRATAAESGVQMS